MREKSSSVLTSLSSRSSLRWTASSSSPCSARSGDASASSVGPSISVSGVRNSWLTLLKNAVLARSSSASASARALASSSACAAAMAVPICEATSDRKSRYAWSSIRRGLVPATRRPTGRSRPGCAIGRTSMRPAAGVVGPAVDRLAAGDSARLRGRLRVAVSGREGLGVEADASAADRSPAATRRSRAASAALRRVGVGRGRCATKGRSAVLPASTRPAIPQASPTVRASRVSAASACVVFRRRSPSTRWRRLGDRDEHTADLAAFLADRAVGKDEVALFGESMPVERQHEIDERGRRARPSRPRTSVR